MHIPYFSGKIHTKLLKILSEPVTLVVWDESFIVHACVSARMFVLHTFIFQLKIRDFWLGRHVVGWHPSSPGFWTV